VVESRTRVGNGHWRTAMRYSFTNALPKAVSVDLRQGGLWGDSRIVSESQSSTRPDASSALWQVVVPANGKAELTVTYDTRW